MRKSHEAGKAEMAAMYNAQIKGLKGQINSVQSQPPPASEVHNHYHSNADSGCTIS